MKKLILLQKYSSLAFYFSVLLALAMVCIPKYFVTGDGPSHVYNAQVVLDYILHHNRDFYKSFYQLNRSINANWIATLYLAFLLKWFPYWLADKLFQVSCILLFAFGFQYTIKKIAPHNIFLAILWFPLLLNIIFQMGFYPFVLAMGLLCWFIGFLTSHVEYIQHTSVIFIGSLLLLLIALTHPLVAVFGFMYVLVILLQKLFFNEASTISAGPFLQSLSIIVIPACIIVFSYLLLQGFSTSQALSFNEKCKALFSRSLFSSVTLKEDIVSTIYTILLFILFSYYSYIAISKSYTKSYGLLFLALMLYVLYFVAPNSVGIGGSLLPRILLFYFIISIFFLAYQNISNAISTFIVLIALACIFSFVYLRFPRILQANIVTKNIMEAAKHIKENSIVHTMHINDFGKNKNGEALFEIDNSLIHVSDYVGAVKNKSILLTNNYEAEYNCFAVQWRPGINPRIAMPRSLSGVYPPIVDVDKYELQINQKIDYLLFQNWDSTYFKLDTIEHMMRKINNLYTLTFENRDVKLYQRN